MTQKEIPPATLSLYELAAHELGRQGSVLDGGCGSGAGADVLCRTFGQVVALDYDPAALASTRRRAPRARVVAGDLTTPMELAPVDAAVLVDVLGHVKTPEAALWLLRAVLGRAETASKPLFIAEPAAHPSQFLAPPARRAFTAQTLARLLAATGYEVVRWLEVDGSFLACLARPFFESAFVQLSQAHDHLAVGRTDEAWSLFESAEREGVRSSVRLEAAVGLAQLSLLSKDADRAVGACIRARAIAPEDVRPAAVLSRIALAVGETEEAKRLATLALRLDPADVEAALAGAVVAAHVGKDPVKERWLVASNLAPDSLELATHLASAALLENDCDLAIFALERVRAYGDDHGAPLHIALAWALLSAGRTADALLETRMADKLAPGDPSVRSLVSRCQALGS